jgi:hypothetical protein
MINLCFIVIFERWLFAITRKADVPEGEGFGGFSVGGQWLHLINPMNYCSA